MFLYYGTRERGEIAGTPPLMIFSHIPTLLTGVCLGGDYFKPPVLTKALGFIAVPASLILLAALKLYWRQLSPLAKPAAICLLGPLAVMFGSWVMSAFTRVTAFGPARYLICIMPMAAILTGELIVRISQTSKYLNWPVRYTNVAVLLFLMANCLGMLYVKVEPFRSHVEKLKHQVRAGDPVIVLPEEVAAGVRMYAPKVQVSLAVDRRASNESQLVPLLQQFNNAERVWMLEYRSAKSPVIKVAKKVLGEFTSSTPSKPLGKVRILQFTPSQKVNAPAEPGV
jgi:hypothetical protein